MVAVRGALAYILAIVFAAGSANAQNGTYPNRPIKLVVGFAAGGGTDVAARIIAQGMSQLLAQTMLVEDRPGASGLVAAQDVAKSDPDGYSLMLGSQTTFACAPNLYRKQTIDAVRDFTPVSLTGSSPLILVANPSFSARSIGDVIALTKANPGKIDFGTGGVGTTPHMTAELFEHDAGIKMAHVAYRGEAGAINDIVAGQIPLMFANLSAVMGNIKAGTLRAIAVTGAKRSPSVPDVPTVAESGLPGFAAETWWGIVGPAGMPRDIVLKLNAAAVQALASEAARARFNELGMSNGTSSPEEFAAYIRSEIAKWSKVIKDAGIQALD